MSATDRAGDIPDLSTLVRHVADLTNVRGVGDLFARLPAMVQAFGAGGPAHGPGAPTGADASGEAARRQGEEIGRVAGEIIARAVREAVAGIQSKSVAEATDHGRRAETGNVFQGTIDRLTDAERKRLPRFTDHDAAGPTPRKSVWDAMGDRLGRVGSSFRRGANRATVRALEVVGKNAFVGRTVKGGRLGARTGEAGFVGGGLQGAAGGWGQFPGFTGKKVAAGGAGAGAAQALGGMAAAAGGAVSAVGMLATAAKAASGKAAEWTKAAEDSARKLASISPEMNAIIQRLDADRMRRDMATAADTAESTARLAEQQSRFEEALRPLQADVVNMQNELAGVLNEFKMALVEELLLPAWEEIKPILQELGFNLRRGKDEPPAMFGNFLVEKRNQLMDEEKRRQAAAENLNAARNARG